MLLMDFSRSVFCDALLTRPNDELLFMSVWGRDTDITELLARLTLPDHPDGIRRFTGKDSITEISATVPSPKLLGKQQGRAPGSVFGDLIRLFIFNKSLEAPDRKSREAWAIYRASEMNKVDVWPLVQDTCHVPLLPSWKDPVLKEFTERGWITNVAGYGVGAVGVHLGSEDVESCIQQLAQNRAITI